MAYVVRVGGGHKLKGGLQSWVRSSTTTGDVSKILTGDGVHPEQWRIVVNRCEALRCYGF